MKKQKSKAPSFNKIHLILLWLTSFLGILDSVYLTYSHYRVHTDMGFKSFCAISKALNCDTVSQSPYAIFLDIPVPIWGILGYVFFVVILFLASQKKYQSKAIFFLLFLISSLFTAYSLILAFLSSYVIHSYCLFCIFSYVINIALLILSWVIFRSFKKGDFPDNKEPFIHFLMDRRNILMPVFGGFIGITLVIWGVLPRYWMIENSSAARNSENMITGVTEDGHPYMGGINPVLTITEFSDYRCFQCKKMHFYIRQLIEKYPEKVRLIHRHFPLDHQYNPIVKRPFHVGSGALSLIAIYATTENRFWETNDIIFSLPKDIKEINTADIARDSGLDAQKLAHFLRDKNAKAFLIKDIKEGIEHKISATPGFLIDGKLYTGKIPPEIIKEKLEM